MSNVRSPFSGELGFSLPGGQALRLLPSQLIPREAVLVDPSQLPAGEYRRWGFAHASELSSAKLPIPTLSLAADVSSRHDLDFLEQDGSRAGGIVFEDAHPDDWWSAVHRNEQLLVLVGDATRATTSDADEQKRILLDSWIGFAPLAIRAYAEGVGTAAPGQ